MNNSDVKQMLDACSDELLHVSQAVAAVGVVSPLVPYLNKYALIRACGAIEVSFKTLIADYCSHRGKKQVKRFIQLRIREGSANPSQDNIVKFLNQFDEDWTSSYKLKLNAEPNKSQLLTALSSLVAGRNDFAHGGNPSFSIADIINNFNNSKRVIEILDEVIR